MKRFEKLYAPALSLLLSALLGIVVIWLCGYDPYESYQALAKGAFGNIKYTMCTLEQSVPLIFAGLACSVAMKSGMFNIGAEGQIYVGALGYTIAGLYFNGLPAPLQMASCILFAILFGALWAAIPALMKIRLGSNEVVTTIMFNFIGKLLVSFLTNGPLHAPGYVPETYPINAAMRIGELVKGYKITGTLPIALFVCLILWILLSKTVLGYKITASGINPRAAQAGGIRTDSVRLGAMILSGALAGLGGGMLIASMYGRLVETVSNGYGFEGISIAVLGEFSPWGVLLASILFGALHTGSLYMEMFLGIPTEILSVLQGVIIVVIAAPLLVKRIAGRFSFFRPKSVERRLGEKGRNL